VSDEEEITRLLYRYAEFIDSGNLAGAAELFAHARIKIAPGDRPDSESIDHHCLLELWRSRIIMYGDGTPRTKHVITNAIVEVDRAARRATSRSIYSVFQQTEGFALQLIVMGRYHDRFEHVSGGWRWSHRDYSLVDLLGDLSHHLKGPLPGSPLSR
jgi:hypothetical protein